MSEKIPEGFKYNEAEVEEYKIRFRDLRLKMSEGDEDEYFDFETLIGNKGDELKFKYGKEHVQRYGMWHAFGSTIDESTYGPIIAHDFPGDDSVAKFIEELEEKYGK